MTVADLQAHLADLSRLMETAGAKAAAAELSAVQTALAPLREQTLKQFAASLGKEKEAVARPRSEPRAAPSADADELGRELSSLYDRSASDEVTIDMIEEFLARLALLSKAALASLAQRIGISNIGNKSKPAIQAAIRQRILNRKGAALRSSMI